MGAVDFGIIVDGAVILVEHLFHKLAARRRAPSTRRRAAACRARSSTRPREVARPTLFSLLIIIAAYLPIFSLQRVEGRIFSPMANTVVERAGRRAARQLHAGAGALRSSRCASRKPHRESPVLRWRARAYEPALALRDDATRRRCWSLALGALVAGGDARCRASGRSSCPSSTRARSTSPSPCPRTSRSTEGRKLTPRSRQLLRAHARGRPSVLIAARPARGRHRPDAAQQPRDLRQAQAARRVAAGHATRSTTSSPR